MYYIAQVTLTDEIWYGDIQQSATLSEIELSKFLATAYYDYEMFVESADILEFEIIIEFEMNYPPLIGCVHSTGHGTRHYRSEVDDI